MTKKPITLNDHLRRAALARWAKTTPEERSAHAKKLVEAREAKRELRKAAAEDHQKGLAAIDRHYGTGCECKWCSAFPPLQS